MSRANRPAAMTRRGVLRSLAGWAACCGSGRLEAEDGKIDPAQWTFIDNGKIRLGVKRTSGAGLAWASLSGSERNLLDHYDHGRLIQQSYYGKPDGSVWLNTPWRWNPVQGGDWKGNPSGVVELKVERESVRSRVHPRNWAGGQLLTDCEMEQEFRLEGPLARLKFSFRYDGKEAHPAFDHELPAAFFNPTLETLAWYEGAKPWTGSGLTRTKPGWPNENKKMPERWAAFVDEKDFGLGLFVPVADRLTCYRYGETPQVKAACSYFAPLVNFAITPGLRFTYEAALAIGTVEEIRAAFGKIRDSIKTPPLPKN